MGNLYIDESIHPKQGFIISACIYSEDDLDDKISEIFQSYKLSPNKFEYKSGANHSKNPVLIKIRDDFKSLLNDCCQLGIVIIPEKSRAFLGQECLKAVKQFIGKGGITKKVSIYFDQEMFISKKSKDNANNLIKALNIDCDFFPEQDSKLVRGIQLADLCAHICSTRLKEKLTGVYKKVKMEAYGGYPEGDIELIFELFATLRNIFFKGEQVSTNIDDRIAFSTITNAGLYISEYCDDDLRGCSQEIFSEIYLGCLH